MLYETFWAALSRNWANATRISLALVDGRAALKRSLVGLGAIDVASLPYNEAVVEYVRRWRAQGGRTALVSASDEELVRAVAAHLALFDEVHGSDGITNLKGRKKAEFLAGRFGPRRFAYMGNELADRPVWEAASLAITVDVPLRVREQIESIAHQAEHLQTRGSRLRPFLRALRPHQWLKNVLIFIPVLAAHQFELLTLLQAALAFLAFSLIASSVYLLNDLLDLPSDRAHPRKRSRPFASGDLPLAYGTVAVPGFLLLGLAVATLLGSSFLLVMVGYALVTTAYSFDLKRRLIVDICTLAGLYTLRIVAGAAATGISLSVWLLAFSIFFFFALAAMKRQAELVSGAAAGEVKAHGRGYHVDDLPFVANMAVSSGYVSVLVMALYLNSEAVRELYPQPAALWGICLILLYWLSRMVMITHRGWMHDDPIVFAARDGISLLCAILILVFALAGVLV